MNKLIKLLAAKKIDEQAINEELKQIDNEDKSNIVELSVVEKIQLHEILYSGLMIGITKGDKTHYLLSNNDIKTIREKLNTDYYKDLKKSIMDIENPEKYKTPTISPKMVDVGLGLCLSGGVFFGIYSSMLAGGFSIAAVATIGTIISIFISGIGYGIVKGIADNLRENFGYAQQNKDIKAVTAYREFLNSNIRDHIRVIGSDEFWTYSYKSKEDKYDKSVITKGNTPIKPK